MTGPALVSVERTGHGTFELVLRMPVTDRERGAEVAAQVRAGDLEPIRAALARGSESRRGDTHPR